MLARSAGDELRPAANESQVVGPTPTLKVPRTLSFESSSTCAPRPSIHEPLTSSVCAAASPAVSATATAREWKRVRLAFMARCFRPRALLEMLAAQRPADL
jgi:hypothetical protein